MKKILLIIILLLTFAVGKSQKMDSTYHTSGRCHVENINTPKDLKNCIEIPITIVFMKTGKVAFKGPVDSTTFILEKSLDRDVVKNSTFGSYIGTMGEFDVLLATRTDNGVLYSVGVFNLLTGEGFIYYIKK